MIGLCDKHSILNRTRKPASKKSIESSDVNFISKQKKIMHSCYKSFKFLFKFWKNVEPTYDKEQQRLQVLKRKREALVKRRSADLFPTRELRQEKV